MRLPAPLALLIALPLLHACGGSLGNDAQVRLINATSNYVSLDLYAGDTRIAAGIAPAAVSDAAGLAEGSYTLALKNGNASTTLVSLSGDLAAQQHAAVLAYVTGGSLKAVVLGEDEPAPAAGTAKLQVANAASSEVGALDVYLVGKTCAALADTDVPAFAGVADVSSSGFSQIAAGSQRVCVTAAGDRSDLRYEVPALTLADQQVATLVLTRSSGGVLLDGLLVDQQGALTHLANPYARVRLAADAAGGASVGAVVGGVTLAAGTSSPTVAAYRLVPAGDLATTVTIGAASQAVTGLSAASGADLTLLVAGSAASPAVSLLVDANLPSSSSSKPVRIRLVDGLNGSAGTTTMTVDGEIVADSVPFGAASTAVNVAASSAASTLQISVGGTVLQTLASQTLADGRVYSLFLLGDAAGTVSAILRADR